MYEFLLDSLDNNEILSYLGSTANERLLDNIEKLKRKFFESVSPRYITAKFSLEKMTSGINILPTNLKLTGNSIKKILGYSDECILMAATLGVETDKLIAYTQKMSISDGVFIDAIASAAIEAVCDGIQSKLAAEYNLTRRFSPGYGDLPLEIQPQILSILNAQKTIGLFCNQSNIMLPRKSVTAILGITNIKQDIENYEDCHLRRNCNLRKAGRMCGH